MRGGLVVFLIIFCGVRVFAQYPYINHFDWMKQQVNPAALGVNRTENLLLNYNRSWINSEVNSNLGILQYDLPLITSNKQNIGGIGVSISDNRVNHKESYNQFHASLSGAFAARIGRVAYLNFGLQGSYYNERINNSGLTTGSQYVPGWGFDPGLGNSEPGMNLSTNYFGISPGIFLYQANDGILPDNYLGFSIKNINRPFNSFYDEQFRLAPLYNLTAGLKLFETTQGKLVAELLYSNYNQNGNLTVGAAYEFLNMKNIQKPTKDFSLRVLSRYSINNKLMVGGQVIYDRFVFGATYDIHTEVTERSFDSGFELLLGIHRKVKAPVRKSGNRRKRKNNLVEMNQPESLLIVEEQIAQLEETLQIVQKDSTEVKTGLEGETKVGELIDSPPLQNFIYFEFASNVISESSHDYLNQLIAEFYRNEKSTIVITGHTDNIGTVEYNQKLSLKRAKAVRQVLIGRGIDPNKIHVFGVGEEQPLFPNDTVANRAKNRRVDLSSY